MLTIEKVMPGNKASRLEGMKCVGPFKCLLVKLNCTEQTNESARKLSCGVKSIMVVQVDFFFNLLRIYFVFLYYQYGRKKAGELFMEQNE